MIKEPVSLDTPVAQDLCLEDYIKDDFKRLPDIKTEKEFLNIEKLRQNIILLILRILKYDKKIKSILS